MTQALRAIWRLLRTLLHIVQAVLRCGLLFPFLDGPARLQQVQRWCVGLLRCLDITVHTTGSVHAGPVLVVANHISWLDILAIIAVHPVRFVSKSDVKHWPVLGWIVACGGTLFIEREKKRDALRVVHHALRYSDAATPISAAAAYVGDTTLLQSLWKVATASKLRVSVRVLPPEGTRHLDRRALTEKVRGEIEAALEQPAVRSL